jgi:hypothetical protein
VGPTIFLFFPFILFPIPPTHHPRRICPRRPRRDSPHHRRDSPHHRCAWTEPVKVHLGP